MLLMDEVCMLKVVWALKNKILISYEQYYIMNKFLVF